MIATQYIKLNMVPSGYPPVLYMSQYDAGRPVGFVVSASGSTPDLDGYTVTLEGTRSDGTPVTAPVTTDGNICALETTATMTNKVDRYPAQIVVTDGNGNRIASIPVTMMVVKAAMNENAEGVEEDRSLYQQYTGTVQSLIADIREDLADLKSAIADINEDIASLNDDLATMSDEIDTVESNVSTNARHIASTFNASFSDMTVLQQETCYIVTDTDHHIAFPSVIYDNQLYLAYRRGSTHVSYDGEIVIKSGSTTSLSDYGTISVSGGDCRDPKLINFGGDLYCLFAVRVSGEAYKTYACALSDLSSPTVILDGYFVGGQPFIDDSTIYIPCYSNTGVYIAYGTSLSSLTLVQIADDGSECAIIKIGDDFLLIYRDTTTGNNGHIIKTSSLTDFEIEDLPFSVCCPCLYLVNQGANGRFIILSSRSDNSGQNIHGFYGQLDLFTMNMDCEFQTPRINLFAGNNTDIGYPSICMQSNIIIIAFYLAFAHSIYIMTVPLDRWYYHQTHGDVAVRNIASQRLNFTSDPTRYQITAPIGTRHILNIETYYPTDTLEVHTAHILYNRMLNSRKWTYLAYNNKYNAETLTVVGKMACLQNKFNSAIDYNGSSNTDGTFIEVTEE